MFARFLFSGGAALGFYHAGVVKALMDNNLMPRVIGGSSAGSIVCSMIGTRTDEECKRDLYNVEGTIAPGHSGRLMLNFFAPVRSEENPNAPRSDIGEVLQNSAGAFKDAKRTWQLFIPIGLRSASSFIYDVITGSRRPQDMLKSDTQHLRGMLLSIRMLGHETILVLLIENDFFCLSIECCKANIGDFTYVFVVWRT
jgi:TAG lipase / steryl ester hydrolase / phospholipase A2 / LPA acyltransferase